MKDTLQYKTMNVTIYGIMAVLRGTSLWDVVHLGESPLKGPTSRSSHEQSTGGANIVGKRESSQIGLGFRVWG